MNQFKQKFATLMACISSAMMCVAPVNCTTVFDAATSATTSLQTKLLTLAEAVLPIMIIVSGISLIFTRDEKKMQAEKKFLIACCAGFVLVLVASKVVPTLKEIFTN